MAWRVLHRNEAPSPSLSFKAGRNLLHAHPGRARATVFALSLVSATIALAGCGLGSGIAPVGPGVYTVSEMRAPVRGGGPAAQQAVLARATAFCQQQGRRMAVLEMHPNGDPRLREWPTAFDMIFRCQ